jgi:murein DD-endopeptidase MepM/ murein hydrolase activator NlpD
MRNRNRKSNFTRLPERLKNTRSASKSEPIKSSVSMDCRPRKVSPSPEDLERIYKDIALVKKVRKKDDPRTDFTQPFIWPVTGRISGVYGSQRILNGKPKRPHYGVDIAAPTGTPVKAPADGRGDPWSTTTCSTPAAP